MAPPLSVAAELDPHTVDFYRRALLALRGAEVPFLVGGALALEWHAKVVRYTKDLDVFVHPDDVDEVLDALASLGCRTEITASHWLGKAFCGDDFVDVIFSSGNGDAPVDDGWFEHAAEGLVLGVPVLICPAEEMLWSKATVMDRGRYDGADVAHTLLTNAERLDWPRLLARFGDSWRMLLAHLVMFGFIYPGERHRIPPWVMRVLLDRAAREAAEPWDGGRVCRGTLLSAEQYAIDIERWGFEDGRIKPNGNLDAEDADWWLREREGAHADRAAGGGQ